MSLMSQKLEYKDIKKLSAKELDVLVQDNEFIAQYKSIPKQFRARLTRKQLLFMG